MPEVYFDGAHNPDGIRAFLAAADLCPAFLTLPAGGAGAEIHPVKIEFCDPAACFPEADRGNIHKSIGVPADAGTSSENSDRFFHR